MNQLPAPTSESGCSPSPLASRSQERETTITVGPTFVRARPIGILHNTTFPNGIFAIKPPIFKNVVTPVVTQLGNGYIRRLVGWFRQLKSGIDIQVVLDGTGVKGLVGKRSAGAIVSDDFVRGIDFPIYRAIGAVKYMSLVVVGFDAEGTLAGRGATFPAGGGGGNEGTQEDGENSSSVHHS